MYINNHLLHDGRTAHANIRQTTPFRPQTREYEKKRKRVHRNFSCSCVFSQWYFHSWCVLVRCSIIFYYGCSFGPSVLFGCAMLNAYNMLRSFYQKPINTEKPLSTWEWRINVRQNVYVYIILWTSTIGTTAATTVPGLQIKKEIRRTILRRPYTCGNSSSALYIVPLRWESFLG